MPRKAQPKEKKRMGRPLVLDDEPRESRILRRIAHADLSIPNPRARKTLKAREAKFVEIYAASDGNLTLSEAAEQAGYPKTTARAMGSHLVNPDKSPHVVAALQRRRAELNAKYGTTYEKHMRDLQFIRDKAIEAGAWAAAVQAEYRRGQALGTIYIDRKEIRHGTIDSMSKEEVQRKLEALRKLYQGSPDVVDVQITQSIEQEKKIDHTEEFLDEAGNSVLSEGPKGDDEVEDNKGGIVGESRDS